MNSELSLLNLIDGDEDLLMEARQAAQQTTAGTVRRVLRAVAIQALSQVLQQQQQQQNNNRQLPTANHRIIVRQEDIEAVQSFCQQLANRWSQANAALGNVQVATCIQDIAAKEGSVLYFVEEENHEDVDADYHYEHVGAAAAASTYPTSATRTTDTANPMDNTNNFVTPHACLMTCLPSQSISESIAMLDKLGKRRQTYWPGSWRTIQAAAAQISYRLYKNQQPEQIELVAPTENDQGGRRAAEWLIDRKRKTGGRERLPPKRAKSNVAPVVAKAPLPPRPPLKHDTLQTWNMSQIRQSFSDQQKECLNQLVMENTDSPPCLVLGALMDLGRYHHYQQTTIDEDSMGAPPSSHKRKRQFRQRRSLGERLGDHIRSSTDYGNTAKRASASRIVQTQDVLRQQAWLDLDLQHVWVEVFDGQARHVLAFETLEFMLLDEDETPGGWPDEEK